MRKLNKRSKSILGVLAREHAFGQDLLIAIDAALTGGAQVLHFYGREGLSIDNNEAGPVTSADRASHASIIHFLRSARPRDSILSEESGTSQVSETKERLWIVDPLDGTKEFIEGIPEFSVMVGLAVGGSAVLGAVYRPDPGVLYVGFADGGAWKLGKDSAKPVPLNVSHDPGDDMRFVRSRSHPDERLSRLQKALAPTDTIQCGSVGVKCALIAQGEADLYAHPVPYLKEWDTCAPEAMLRGAGGRVTDCEGEPLTYGKQDPVQLHGIFAARQSVWVSRMPIVAAAAL